MAKDPAMLFYTSDFLTGVTLLSMKERGQYITLLCLQQQMGHMSLGQMQTAVGRLTPALLAKYVQDENGLYYNRRAEEEILKRQAHCEKQRATAKKRWDPEAMPEESHGTCHGISHGIAMAMPLENENEKNTPMPSEPVLPEPEEPVTPSPEPKAKPRKKKAEFIPPTREEVREYCRQRGSTVDPDQFFDYFTADPDHPWVDAKGNQVHNWKGKIITWEKYDSRCQAPQHKTRAEQELDASYEMMRRWASE